MIKALKQFDARAIENLCQKGTPDVECILGWIELKWVEKWPARSKTPLRIDHYTKEQRIWARTRVRRGGSCWLLLQVEEGDQWLLFCGRWAALNIAGDGGPPRGACRAELEAAALGNWSGLDEGELRTCLLRLSHTRLSD